MPRTAAAVMADPITGAPAKGAKLPKVTDGNMSAAERKAVNDAAAKKTAAKEYKPPKNLAQCADEYYRKREQRLALERQAALVQAEENACREFLINNLPKSQASGIAGKLCRVTVENKTVYQVKEWDKVWGFILNNAKKMPGITGMLQRRINENMVKEMAESGKVVPGTESVEVPVLRYSKL
jgi:hypothetical protein